MVTWIFWISLGVLFYTYLGYGLVLLLILKVRQVFAPAVKPPPATSLPAVTMVVAAFNEEGCIAAKVENCFALDYPAGRLRFIFISDGSTDQTAAILDRYEGLLHLHQPERQGKSAALNLAMQHVDTPIVVFSDANAVLNRESIRLLAAHFNDPGVGGVAGEKKVQSRNSSAAGTGEGMYWKYESTLKKWDAAFYSIVGAAGELFAMRRELYEKMRPDTVLDDFYQSLRVCIKGYRVRYEPRAFATELASSSLTEEHKRKVRICAGGFQAMGRLGILFNPFFNPRLSFQYISHRILRWTLGPFCLILLLVSNFILVSKRGESVYEVALWSQLVFYGLAIIGWILGLAGRTIRLFNLPYYFLLMQIAVIQGFIRYAGSGQPVTWEKSEREKSTII